MAAPKGNKNALGGPGGGRPSWYQEKANAEWLAKAFFEDHSLEELQKMAEEQHISKSIAERMVKDALAGNKDYILAIFKKLFPDLSKTETEHKGELTLTEKLRNEDKETDN